jgi:transposase
MVKVAKFVGLDVHKDTIAIAVADGGPFASAIDVATVPHDVPKLVRKLLTLAPAEHLSVVYEAGPTGFGLCRELCARGIRCMIVAPNRVPQMPGPRIKTDKRDARHLANLLRIGSLSPITLPDVELEALRDLVRAREDALMHRRRVRQQLGGFILRHGFRYSDKTKWTEKHMAWASSLQFGSRAQDLARDHYYHEILRLNAAIDELTAHIESIAHELSGVHGELYRALQALRGVKSLVAATIVCELGDLRRFKSASQLMSYLGMVPSEYSSGARTKRGSITKAGNPHVRRVLIEAAWSGRLRPARGVALLKRQEGLPEAVIDIAWKAQKRLHARYTRMTARLKPQNVAIVALARELVGFMWAIGQEVTSKSA